MLQSAKTVCSQALQMLKGSSRWCLLRVAFVLMALKALCCKKGKVRAAVELKLCVCLWELFESSRGKKAKVKKSAAELCGWQWKLPAGRDGIQAFETLIVYTPLLSWLWEGGWGRRAERWWEEEEDEGSSREEDAGKEREEAEKEEEQGNREEVEEVEEELVIKGSRKEKREKRTRWKGGVPRFGLPFRTFHIWKSVTWPGVTWPEVTWRVCWWICSAAAQHVLLSRQRCCFVSFLSFPRFFKWFIYLFISMFLLFLFYLLTNAAAATVPPSGARRGEPCGRICQLPNKITLATLTRPSDAPPAREAWAPALFPHYGSPQGSFAGAT